MSDKEKLLIALGPVDGPLFRKQRLMLLKVRERLNLEEGGLMGGVINLLDEVADQLHDVHKVDCLLTSDPKRTFTVTYTCENCYQCPNHAVNNDGDDVCLYLEMADKPAILPSNCGDELPGNCPLLNEQEYAHLFAEHVQVTHG